MLTPIVALGLTLVCLTLVSCSSLFCPPPPPGGGAGAGPTPGNDCLIQVTPTVPGKAAFWVGYNLNGNATVGPPTFHSLFIGSADSDIKVGGATATMGTAYMLVIESLTSGAATAKLKVSASDPGQNVTLTNVTSSATTSDTFSTYVRDTPAPSDLLTLDVLVAGKGVQIGVRK